MSNQPNYEFGPFRLIPKEHKLLHNGRTIPLTPRAFDLLVVLVENSGHMLEKDELLKRVWKTTFVEEGTMTRSISTLRRVFAEEDGTRQYIETIPTRGYRFVAEVTASNGDDVDHGGPVQGLPVAASSVSEENGVASEPIDVAGPSTASPVRSRWRRYGAVGSVLILGIIAVVSIIALRSSRARVIHFGTVEAARLTESGKIYAAALSPDGKYLAYVVFASDQEVRMSAWIRQLSTHTDLQVVPAQPVLYKGVRFSPDGSLLYYVTDDLAGHSSLFQVSALGGFPRKLVDHVSSTVGFSPDGGKITFVRQDAALHQLELVTADADGGHPRVLVTKKLPGLLRSPVWSPDGKLIACISEASYSAGPRVTVVGFDATNGKEKRLLPEDWSLISQLAWLGDGSGLVMTGMAPGSKISHIWMVHLPDGEATNITLDVTDYSGVSLDSSSTRLVTVQTAVASGMWVVDPQNSNTPGAQVSRGALDGMHGVSWNSSGQLLYAAGEKGEWQIWSVNEDGSNRRQLTFGPASNYSASACRSSQYVAFISSRAGGQHIWRMNADGADPVQLTYGLGEETPRCSPDGKWVVYTAYSAGQPQLWKVSTSGGEPVQLSDNATILNSTWPSVSPDGKLIAFRSMDIQKRSAGVAVIPFEGGPPIHILQLGFTPVRWSPDSRSLTYVQGQGNVDNLWSQPVDGGPPRQITHFDALQIFNFDWSADGKRLALARGLVNTDVIELQDLTR
jgi:Tol biopolymer transport system component/DNA-binding winged helix-turn-helix (wHTH) protein